MSMGSRMRRRIGATQPTAPVNPSTCIGYTPLTIDPTVLTKWGLTTIVFRTNEALALSAGQTLEVCYNMNPRTSLQEMGIQFSPDDSKAYHADIQNDNHVCGYAYTPAFAGVLGCGPTFQNFSGNGKLRAWVKANGVSNNDGYFEANTWNPTYSTSFSWSGNTQINMISSAIHVYISCGPPSGPRLADIVSLGYKIY